MKTWPWAGELKIHELSRSKFTLCPQKRCCFKEKSCRVRTSSGTELHVGHHRHIHVGTMVSGMRSQHWRDRCWTFPTLFVPVCPLPNPEVHAILESSHLSSRRTTLSAEQSFSELHMLQVFPLALEQSSDIALDKGQACCGWKHSLLSHSARKRHCH